MSAMVALGEGAAVLLLESSLLLRSVRRRLSRNERAMPPLPTGITPPSADRLAGGDLGDDGGLEEPWMHRRRSTTPTATARTTTTRRSRRSKAWAAHVRSPAASSTSLAMGISLGGGGAVEAGVSARRLWLANGCLRR